MLVFRLCGWFCFYSALIFDQFFGQFCIYKYHALAKTNPTQNFNKSFTKEGDEEGSAMKEHSLDATLVELSKAEFPNEILSPF